jgi:N-acetylneuraminic acid mutarotase
MFGRLLFCMVAISSIISCKKVNESSITVTRINPDSDGPGATIEIDGRGFGNNPAAAAVYFNGVGGTIYSCSDSVMLVVIPNGATTGMLTITSAGHHTYKSSTDYIILTGTWIKKANFPGVARSNAASFSINNIGYVATGADINLTPLADMYAYDPVADFWTKKASLPGPPRSLAFGITIGNKGYLIGGWSGPSSGLQYLPDVWEYDPAADSWTQKMNFPGTPKIFAGGFAIGNIAYYGLGYESANSNANDWWRYDPTSDSWTKKADFVGYLYSANYGFSIGGTGYLLIFGSYQNWYSYDTATDQWTTRNSNPTYIEPAGMPFTIGNQGYYIPGTGSFHETWVYDPPSDSWSRKTSPNILRGEGVGVALNNRLYIGLGVLDASGSGPWPTDWWELQP